MRSSILEIRTGDTDSHDERTCQWRRLMGEHLIEADIAPVGAQGQDYGLTGYAIARTIEGSSMAHIRAGGQHIRRRSAHIGRAEENCVLVNLILAGRCDVEQYGRQFQAAHGSIFLYDAARAFEIKTSEDFETIAIKFEKAKIVGALGNIELYGFDPISMDVPAAAITFDLWGSVRKQLFSLSDQVGSIMYAAGIESLIANFAASIEGMPRPRIGSSLIVLRAQTFIARSFHREDLTINDIARATGVSVRRLQECFQEHGLQPMKSLRCRRLDHAKVLLKAESSRHLSITSIMESCGYSDPATFSRTFRDKFGNSPRSYRKNRALRNIGVL